MNNGIPSSCQSHHSRKRKKALSLQDIINKLFYFFIFLLTPCVTCMHYHHYHLHKKSMRCEMDNSGQVEPQLSCMPYVDSFVTFSWLTSIIKICFCRPHSWHDPFFGKPFFSRFTSNNGKWLSSELLIVITAGTKLAIFLALYLFPSVVTQQTTTPFLPDWSSLLSLCVLPFHWNVMLFYVQFTYTLFLLFEIRKGNKCCWPCEPFFGFHLSEMKAISHYCSLFHKLLQISGSVISCSNVST